MHGRVQREGESIRSLQRSISQHMRSVPPLATSNRTIAAACGHSSVTSSTITTTSTASDSFLKVTSCRIFHVFVVRILYAIGFFFSVAKLSYSLFLVIVWEVSD